MSCPACSCKQYKEIRPSSIYECKRCGALYGKCYLGVSYEYVLPYMTGQDIPIEQIRYFDFETLGSEGRARRHGWFDTETKLITQVG